VDVALTERGLVVVVAPASDDWSSTLTARERDVAAAVARGLTNRQIAQELFVSVATVKDHVHHILAKTGLPNRAAVAGRWRAAAHD
jgi:DNA-binding NarL/FixJ family response regulator